MFTVKFGILRFSTVRLNSFYTVLSSKQLCRNSSTLIINNSVSNSILNDTLKQKCLKNCAVPFSSEQAVEPANPDVFGDIGGNQYESLELDDDEKEQEQFETDESMLPRRLKLSPGRYARLISDHIAKGDLYAAMNVLGLAKSNRDKPTTYMYNLLLRGHAVQGKLKQSFKLYNDMKKRALKLNSATYVSMINACANSSEKEQAIEILGKVRDEMMRLNIPMNVVHYNVMIKAYGKHNCLLEAFQMVDEMIDKGMVTGQSTFNSLLFASISDKENGLRHALIVWHLMQQRRLKPSILTFNLLLRAMRETEFGDLKVSDKLIEGDTATQILLCDGVSPDLLSKTPVISPLVINSLTTQTINAPEKPVRNLSEYKSSSAASALCTTENKIMESSSAESLNEVRLNTIHKKNRLILFGGYTGFIDRMEKNNVTPDAKTLTLLMEVAPPSLKIENDIIRIARVKKIPLDIDFFNMLIKKRSSRRDYKNAKEVLGEVQLHGLIPNMITWGVLALGCLTHKEGLALLEGMEATGHTLNPIIATTLLNNACSSNYYPYIFYIIELMYRNRVRPTETTYKVLDSFQRKMSDIMHGRVKSRNTNSQRHKEMFSKFNLRYDSFQQQFGRVKEGTKSGERRH